jgi:hypothetical protein
MDPQGAHRHASAHRSLWAPEYPHVLAPARLVPGDCLDRDGTTWIVTGVEPLDDGSVVVVVRRTSCNGLPGRYRLRLGADTPMVCDGAPPGRRHVRALDAHVR